MVLSSLLGAVLVVSVTGQTSGSGGFECPPDAKRKSGRIETGFAVWCEAPDFFGGTSKNGPYREFRSDKTLLWAGSFVNGRPDGVWVKFDPEGQPTERRTYVNGNLIATERLQSAPEGFEGPEDESELEGFEGPSESGVGPQDGGVTVRPKARARPKQGYAFDDDPFSGDRPVAYQLSVGSLRQGQSSFGLAGRLIYFLPMLDISYRYGLADPVAFDLRAATVAFFNYGSVGLSYRLAGDEKVSLHGRTAFDVEALFPSILFDASGLGAFGFDLVSLSPTPGLGISFGNRKYQVSLGTDVRLIVFSAFFGSDEDGLNSSGTGLSVAVRPRASAEFRLGRSKSLFLEAMVDTLVREDVESQPVRGGTIVFFTVGVTFDLTKSSRRFDAF
jgi:hypothetical protein